MKLLQVLNNVLREIEKLLLTSGIIGLAIITIGNVISRKAFNASWSWAEEVSQFILVLITYMGISYAARKGRHIRMTAFNDMMNNKGKKIMAIIVAIITFIFLFYLSYYSALYVLKAKEIGRITPALRFPYYLVVIWVPIGLFTAGIQYVLTVIKNIKEKDVWLSAEEKYEYK